MLRELRNEEINFINVKFEMSIRYPRVNID